jgi:deoxycytidylate deaminase
MVAKPKSKPTPLSSVKTSSTSSTSSIDIITTRQSNELIIGLCGAVGSGVKSLARELIPSLELMGYKVNHIRISSLMDEFTTPPKNLSGYERYEHYQNTGDKLRKEGKKEFLAEGVITTIASIRKKLLAESSSTGSDGENENIKIAYIVDQLKNPTEVELFRLVYPNNFYLLGVIRTINERKRNLSEEGISEKELNLLISRDKKDKLPHGQQVQKTILTSDYFIRNKHSQSHDLRRSCTRFVNLIHGANGNTPTKDENGMYAAFSASLRSACLSRQVGASITNSEGTVIATGCNDVPSYGGGLYNTEDGYNDYRCVHKGRKCYNDFYKQAIQKDIDQIVNQKADDLILSVNELLQTNGINVGQVELNKILNLSTIPQDIIDNTKVGSLIEFSRAIHAEMDAITSLARNSSVSTLDCTLFSTTYPCHSCARHIVAANISRVVYIEPYEKSLALKLHDDAITDTDEPNKVIFEAFEGVSPRRYMKFFGLTGKRKDRNGDALEFTSQYNNHVDIQFLDSYKDYEKKILTEHTKKVKVIKESIQQS